MAFVQVSALMGMSQEGSQMSRVCVPGGQVPLRTLQKMASEAAGDVVLPGALPGPEGPGGADPSLTGVQAQHHLTQGHRVEAALGCGADAQVSHGQAPSSVSGSARSVGAQRVAVDNVVTMATASAVRAWMPAKSPDFARSRGTIQEPPTAATAGMVRYSARFLGPTPPVGTNRTSPNGAASALIAAAPPEVPAGKNFTVVMPSSSAAWTSVAVTAPGSASTPFS